MRGRLCRLGTFQEMRSQARWNYFWEIKVCISSILLYFAPNSCSQSPIYSQNVSEVGSSWKHYKVENIPIFAIAPGINCPTFSSRGKNGKNEWFYAGALGVHDSWAEFLVYSPSGWEWLDRSAQPELTCKAVAMPKQQHQSFLPGVGFVVT